MIVRLIGHSTTRMVDLVYGRLDDDTLAKAMDQQGDLGLPALPRKSPIPDRQRLRAVAAGGSRSGSKRVFESGSRATTGDPLNDLAKDRPRASLLHKPVMPKQKATAPPPRDDGAAVPRDRIAASAGRRLAELQRRPPSFRSD